MTFLVSIPLTNHRNLARPISGRFLTAHDHGTDIEFVLENRGSFHLYWEDARGLARAAGSSLRGPLLTYDGHRIVLEGGL